MKPSTALFLALWTTTASVAEDSAELILRDGLFYPVSSEAPVAGSLAVRAGRIVFLGPTAEAERWRGPETRVIELAGRAATPGLIDSHAHLYSLGRTLEQVDLTGVASYERAVEMLRRAAGRLPAGHWLYARGWDQNDWPDTAFPHHLPLSREIPDHPVWATRIDGHAVLLNERAMRELGLGRDVHDPTGGRHVRDEEGELTGVLIDEAMNLAAARVPAPEPDQYRRWIEAGQEHCLARGLTTVTDMGIGADAYAAYRRLRDEDRLELRAALFLDDQPELLAAWLERGPHLDPAARLLVRGIKLYADGALGSRGAALIEPYSDDPGNLGWLTVDSSHVLEVCSAALRAGFQVGIHAIGDRGALLALDALERCFTGPRPDVRFRLEHAQVMRQGDIERMARLGVIASMQPTHATSDMPWAEDRLGAHRLDGAYAWRRVLEAGGRLALGSDFPVEAADPLLGVYAAVTRRDLDGHPPGGWLAEQSLTRAEALRGFTLDAAHSLFLDHELGTLEPGKRADIVVFSDDPMSVEDAEIPAVEVDLTIVEGEIVFDAKEQP